MSFITKNGASLIRLGFSHLRGKNYPFVTVLRLNDACNMSCNYCDSYKLSKSIDIDNLLKFLDRLYKRGNRFIILTGGEAFLYKDRKKLMDWLSARNIYLVINSNGFLIGNKEYEAFLNSADEVLVSIDGPMEYNNAHRGKGTNQRVIKTLDYLKEKKKKITLSVVLTALNSNEKVYDYIRDLKKKYGATVGINPVTGNGRINNTDYSNKMLVSQKQMEDFRQYVRRNQASFKEIPSLLVDYMLKPRPFKCKTMNYAIYVDVTHGVYPCINVTDREDASFGNIENFDFDYKKEISCQQCNCTPLIMGNLMFQKGKIPSPKTVYSIFKRHL